MKTIRNLGCALLTSLALLIATNAFGRTAGEHVDDTTLATTTKAALIDSHNVSSAGAINVEVHKGVIQLAGFVGSEADRQGALAVARGMSATGAVLDAMTLSPGHRSAGETIDDTTTQARLKSALAEQLGAADALAINTEVRKGQVILSGFVDEASIRDEAGRIATGVRGVVSVLNGIAVGD